MTRPVLIIDDEQGIRDSLAMFLRRQGYDVVEAESAEQALATLEAGTYPLIVCDISLPGNQTGLDILRHVKSHCPDSDVIMMTGHLDVDFAITALKDGAFDYFKKPFLFDEVELALQRARERRRLLERSRELDRLRQRQETMIELHTQFMISLAAMIDAKSPYTRAHSDRVSVYAKEMARSLELTGAELRCVTIGGKLHDIGKIGTPEGILNKPAPLNDVERRVVEEHPVRGAELLQPISFMEPYLPVVRWHHENWDGSGYPDGLAGDEIPLSVQLVKIADYYDAITSNRPYRKPMTLNQATRTLEDEAGKAFEPELVERFVRLIHDAPWAPRSKGANQVATRA